jgi:hypothetical protein
VAGIELRSVDVVADMEELALAVEEDREIHLVKQLPCALGAAPEPPSDRRL